ncbi:hypothetical protein AB0B83_18540, partial [Micromonospora sp. NPDC049060]|uniref:hypothetical protein n=1 Tax=Micromonospora sp. NPDC049060 TaxID=3154828 RepID=UPI0033E7F98D
MPLEGRFLAKISGRSPHTSAQTNTAMRQATGSAPVPDRSTRTDAKVATDGVWPAVPGAGIKPDRPEPGT